MWWLVRRQSCFLVTDRRGVSVRDPNEHCVGTVPRWALVRLEVSGFHRQILMPPPGPWQGDMLGERGLEARKLPNLKINPLPRAGPTPSARLGRQVQEAIDRVSSGRDPDGGGGWWLAPLARRERLGDWARSSEQPQTERRSSDCGRRRHSAAGRSNDSRGDHRSDDTAREPDDTGTGQSPDDHGLDSGRRERKTRAISLDCTGSGQRAAAVFIEA